MDILLNKTVAKSYGADILLLKKLETYYDMDLLVAKNNIDKS